MTANASPRTVTGTGTSTVVSRDGTRIAYERVGSGPPLILVDGAFCTRTMGPGRDLAPALSERFSVYTYDRRGRGASGDRAPYAVEREIEDLRALIEAAGGTADVFGHSSGASLALEAARQGLPIRRMALYEAPMIVDDSRPPVGERFGERVQALVAADRRSDAVKLFMTEAVRAPKIMTVVMPLMPAWAKVTAVPHTVPYDVAVIGEDALQGRPLTADRWTDAAMPILVLAGGKSPAWMRNAMRQLAEVLPQARLRLLERQTHMVKPAATAPALVEFFAAP
ncbi:MAG TPA: alpha/beta hydrolase [Thermomicrobiaceae bacterium]|nr:alpha/beta hydrolase [Thermomicrobiaceae bacterium]